MKLIFERSVPGRRCSILPECDVPVIGTGEKPLSAAGRKSPLRLPQVSENDISRHYTALANATHGVNDGSYPLGSCTMKYNPKLNDEMASLPGFTRIHPLQPEETVQGCLHVLHDAERVFCEITGMDAMTFQPAAGAHGEFTGLLLIRAYHESRGDVKRTKIIVPDSAHGTNPASATMAGYQVINIPSTKEGCVDLEALRAAVGEDTAGLMLTNPNTVGLFDKNILEITRIVHESGGLCYYDGANLNAVMGVARPGDMGFDTVHLNLHKTFSTPHGGGGPGSGPVGCKAFLGKFLPGKEIREENGVFYRADYEKSIGMVRAFYGNFLVVVKALCYALTLGAEGIRDAAHMAVLNANYLRVRLSEAYHMAYQETCMHEFVMTLQPEKEELQISAMDIAKALLDYGIHPPTMYFPLIVHEALMVEPTETESPENLEELISAFMEIHRKAQEDPEWIRSAPHKTEISRLDEVQAARNPKLHYEL
ncbi:aminomethyl-transferring glycine dehydrogenase subunit GcvPB [Eisenbergiella porci]|uniref:aminomethyl-transferring glycine dehydrogenase subunit GcvPB n=1 Tax=Eisenbergiella porci TaxID=2652274 RepID=UPI002A832B80|nr:aminomethyl-transferring glycine dehydrogenase subunit GcvPB [Eisenbergiella porci]